MHKYESETYLKCTKCGLLILPKEADWIANIDWLNDGTTIVKCSFCLAEFQVRTRLAYIYISED